MTHAYREAYLRKAMTSIAVMFDYAINDFGISSYDFVEMFISSSISLRLEIGEPKYLTGMCGEELALRVIEETTGIVPEAEAFVCFERSPDYWCGRVIAYYQWLSGVSYKELFKIATYEEIRALYQTLHEADITKFAEIMESRRRSLRRTTNLKRIRSAYGCSQSELASISNVSLRSIQMYEQIGRAHV